VYIDTYASFLMSLFFVLWAQHLLKHLMQKAVPCSHVAAVCVCFVCVVLDVNISMASISHFRYPKPGGRRCIVHQRPAGSALSNEHWAPGSGSARCPVWPVGTTPRMKHIAPRLQSSNWQRGWRRGRGRMACGGACLSALRSVLCVVCCVLCVCGV
jgi:hypothetical protein